MLLHQAAMQTVVLLAAYCNVPVQGSAQLSHGDTVITAKVFYRADVVKAR